MEKKLDNNYTRILQTKLNKSWRQHPTKQQLFSHLTPIMKSIQIRWTIHVRHCWRSKDKLISDVLLWTPTHGQAKAGRSARTCIQQLCADTGWSLEDLPGVMDGRDGWQEKVREICDGSVTWWRYICWFAAYKIFSCLFHPVVFHWSLNDCKSLWISRTL